VEKLIETLDRMLFENYVANGGLKKCEMLEAKGEVELLEDSG